MPDETRIEFTLAATLHTVYGRAQLLSGEVNFDGKTGAVKGAVRIDARTITTNNQVRDRKMHQEILESHLFPDVIFRLRKVVLSDATSKRSPRLERYRKTTNRNDASGRGFQYSSQVLGTLDIHGSRHELSFPVDIRVQANRVHVEAHFAIPYVKWGMRDPSVFVLRVAKAVDVSINATGILNGPLPTLPLNTLLTPNRQE